MGIVDSSRKAWAWLNARTVSPWAVTVLLAVGTFFYWQATVSAQGTDLEELKVTTEKRIDETKLDLREDQKLLRDDIIDRLDDLKDGQRRQADKIDKLSSAVAELKARSRIR